MCAFSERVIAYKQALLSAIDIHTSALCQVLQETPSWGETTTHNKHQVSNRRKGGVSQLSLFGFLFDPLKKKKKGSSERRPFSNFYAYLFQGGKFFQILTPAIWAL